MALLGIRDRSLWVASLVVLLAMLPLIPLWVQYATVIRGTTVGLAYSILNLPLVLLPVAALPFRSSQPRPAAAS